MSLRRSVRPALRATHPALFLVGLALAGAQAVLYLLLAVLEAAVGSIYGTALSLAGPLVVVAVTAPLAVGLYAPVRERTDTVRGTFRCAVRGIRRHYARVFAATLAAFAAAFVLAVAGTALLFVLGTLAKFSLYVVGDPGQPNVWLATWAFPLLFVACLTVGVTATRFADVAVAFGGDSPRAGWRSSLAFLRREPRSFLGYALVVAVLLGTPQVLAFAFGAAESAPAVAAAIGLVVLVGTVGVVLASALHVTYFERTVEPTLRATPPRPVRWSRLAVVAVVLLAAVAGASTVRAADLGAGQAEIRPLPEDPQAAYAVAAANTRDANHRRQVATRNASEAGASFRTVSRSAVDYDQRRATVFFEGNPDVRVGGFQGEGTIAMPSGGYGAERGSLAPLTDRRGNWTVVAAPGYGLIDPADVGPVPEPGDGWSVATSNESTTVYRVERPAAIEAAIPGSYNGMQGGLAEGSTLTVAVDRERAVVDRARFTLRSRETGHAYEYEMRFSDVGTATVDRPTAIGPRSPLERVWDVLYY